MALSNAKHRTDQAVLDQENAAVHRIRSLSRGDVSPGFLSAGGYCRDHGHKHNCANLLAPIWSNRDGLASDHLPLGCRYLRYRRPSVADHYLDRDYDRPDLGSRKGAEKAHRNTVSLEYGRYRPT